MHRGAHFSFPDNRFGLGTGIMHLYRLFCLCEYIADTDILCDQPVKKEGYGLRLRGSVKYTVHKNVLQSGDIGFFLQMVVPAGGDMGGRNGMKALLPYRNIPHHAIPC